MKAVLIADGNYITKIAKNDYGLRHSNLPHSLFNIFEQYRDLIKEVDLHLLRIRYHDSPAFLPNNDPTAEEQKEYDKKEFFFKKHITPYQRIDLIRGRCQRITVNGNYEYNQKGVDVNMAIDIVQYSATVDTIIVVSADSDLIPAFVLAKTKGAEVVLVTSEKVKRFPDSSVDKLINAADLHFVIEKEMLKKSSQMSIKR